MTNFEFVKSLDIDEFVDILSLPTSCPICWRNNMCEKIPTCLDCWKKWLNSEYVSGVPGGIVRKNG